jgi:hypothetical protein
MFANKQLHDESLRSMYGGRNVFALAVSFKQLAFRLRYTVTGGIGGRGIGGGSSRIVPPLTPSASLEFPGAVGGLRATGALRHIVVMVERADEYEGMIKYNCGGRELVEGVKSQVALLVRILAGPNSRKPRRLGSVEVRLESVVAAGRNILRPSRSIGSLFSVVRRERRAQIDGGTNASGSGGGSGGGGVRQEVLEPFGRLRAERAKVSGEGVDRAFAERLERKMMGEGDEEEDMSIMEEVLPLPASLENRVRSGETRAPLLSRLPDG